MVYIFNRSSTLSLNFNTAYEAWYNKKPNVKHFRFFGFLSYAHIPDENLRKLDPKSQAYIFISYYDQTNVYRLYNTKIFNFFLSTYVIFYKGGEWNIKISLLIKDPMVMNPIKCNLLIKIGKKALPFQFLQR